MKLTSKHYSNQIFKKASFCNGGLAEWWTKKTFKRCDFDNCDFTDIMARGCRFIGCVFISRIPTLPAGLSSLTTGKPPEQDFSTGSSQRERQGMAEIIGSLTNRRILSRPVSLGHLAHSI